MNFRSTAAAMLLGVICSACSNHYYYPHYSYSEEPVTLGTVQRKLYKGMCQDRVAYVLGAPNIVTKDKYGREAWIYDKQNTEVDTSESSSGIWMILGRSSGESKKATTSQKTITIIVKFDEDSLIDHISYHQSEF